MKRSPYEGLQKNIRHLKTPDIETWTNKYPERDYVVKIEMPEFTCLCPKTGLPDFARIVIQYIPDRLCLELKSLKYYELFFRQHGIFHEHVVNKMLEDIVRCTRPRWAEVVGEFNARGGIRTTVRAEYGEHRKCEK